MSDFNLGDVVKLKSGGPEMTIDELSGTQAHCTWFEKTKRTGSWFELVALTKA
jgi:uncharacterized protein YodC (DUF2158 family)